MTAFLRLRLFPTPLSARIMPDPPTRRLVLLLACLACWCQEANAGEAAGFDVILRQGRLIDGNGTPGRVTDVAIADGRIYVRTLTRLHCFSEEEN